MKIGLDFDNTIVSYDRLFYDIALQKGYIRVEDAVSVTKNAVRDALRAKDMEEEWIWMQGYGYGFKIRDATPFDGAVDVIRALQKTGAELFIVSHKTRYPFRGERYDLHEAARQWIKSYLVDETGRELLRPGNVFFNLTKAEKINRIGQCGCDFFLDDLQEILSDPLFPKHTQGILFAPAPPSASHNATHRRINHWNGLYDLVNRV